MRVALSHTKKGLPSALDFFMKSVALGMASAASKSFIRSCVSGPVSVSVCLPTRPKRGSTVESSLSLAKAWITPRVPNFFS